MSGTRDQEGPGRFCIGFYLLEDIEMGGSAFLSLAGNYQCIAIRSLIFIPVSMITE